jgi:hypothetical protein
MAATEREIEECWAWHKTGPLRQMLIDKPGIDDQYDRVFEQAQDAVRLRVALKEALALLDQVDELGTAYERVQAWRKEFKIPQEF